MDVNRFLIQFQKNFVLKDLSVCKNGKHNSTTIYLQKFHSELKHHSNNMENKRFEAYIWINAFYTTQDFHMIKGKKQPMQTLDDAV